MMKNIVIFLTSIWSMSPSCNIMTCIPGFTFETEADLHHQGETHHGR